MQPKLSAYLNSFWNHTRLLFRITSALSTSFHKQHTKSWSDRWLATNISQIYETTLTMELTLKIELQFVIPQSINQLTKRIITRFAYYCLFVINMSTGLWILSKMFISIYVLKIYGLIRVSWVTKDKRRIEASSRRKGIQNRTPFFSPLCSLFLH